jgi:hypothetical protein
MVVVLVAAGAASYCFFTICQTYCIRRYRIRCMDYLAQGLRRIPLTGPVSALFYKKLHTKFYSINKNNSLPVQISFYNYKHDVLFNAPKEIHPDQVDDTNSFNFAIIRNPYERSISLADALYFAQVKVKYKTVPSTMYHCIEDPEYTKKYGNSGIVCICFMIVLL